jgi:hypothetical protein
MDDEHKDYADDDRPPFRLNRFVVGVLLVVFSGSFLALVYTVMEIRD